MLSLHDSWAYVCQDECHIADLGSALAALRVTGRHKLMSVFMFYARVEGQVGIQDLVRFLTSVNRCLLIASPRLVRAGYGPLVLARQAAARAFSVFGLEYEDSIDAEQWGYYIDNNAACAEDR